MFLKCFFTVNFLGVRFFPQNNSAIERRNRSAGGTSLLIQILVDLLEQGVKAHVRLRLLDHMQELHMLCDDLPEVCHLLEHLGEQL